MSYKGSNIISLPGSAMCYDLYLVAGTIVLIFFAILTACDETDILI
jgi:hypothetical protein